MSIKYRKNRTEFYECYRRDRQCKEIIVGPSMRTLSEVAYTDAIRNRRKPRHLLPTPLVYVESLDCSDFSHHECKPGRPGCGSLSNNSGSYPYVKPTQGFKWNRSISPGSSVRNSARLRAEAAFTEQAGSFGESLGSLTETGKMIHKRAKQIANIASALRNRNFGRLEHELKSSLPSSVKRVKKGRELANGWLELEFGWKPLIQDVYDGVEAYRKGLVENGTLVKATGQRSGNFTLIPGLPRGSNYSNLKANDLTPRIRSRAYGVVRNSRAFTLNQLGLANPALLAWQLLPFSFVVDWFLPISSILGMISNRVGLSQYVVCVTWESQRAKEYNCDSVLANASRTVRREVHSSVFTDSMNLSPRSLGLWHAATASALIRQSFGR